MPSVARRNENSDRDLVGKIGRDGGIRTHGPLTPSQVRYQAALHPDRLSLVRLKPDTTCSSYADARLFLLAGRAGFLAATRFDATDEGFDRAAIDRRAPLTSVGDSSR